MKWRKHEYYKFKKPLDDEKKSLENFLLSYRDYSSQEMKFRLRIEFLHFLMIFLTFTEKLNARSALWQASIEGKVRHQKQHVFHGTNLRIMTFKVENKSLAL